MLIIINRLIIENWGALWKNEYQSDATYKYYIFFIIYTNFFTNLYKIYINILYNFFINLFNYQYQYIILIHFIISQQFHLSHQEAKAINFKNQIPLKETNFLKPIRSNTFPTFTRQFLPTPRRIQLFRKTQSHFLILKKKNPQTFPPPLIPRPISQSLNNNLIAQQLKSRWKSQLPRLHAFSISFRTPV